MPFKILLIGYGRDFYYPGHVIMNRGMVATPIKLLLYYGKTWYCSWLTQINSEIVSGQCFWGEFWDNGVKTITEGSLEVKLPTIWTDGKAEVGRVREEKRREEERRSEKRKSQKKEDAGARKGRKVAKHCVFPMICGSRGSKSRLAKAAGAEPTSQTRDEQLHAVVARNTFRSQNVQNTPRSEHFWKLRSKKCTPLWRDAHLKVNMYKTHHLRSTFGSYDVQKVSKSARHCGAKHISKSTCTKHVSLRTLLEVEMLKKWTPLWREALVSCGRRKGLCTLSKVSKT